MEALENTRIYTVKPEPVRQLNRFEKHHEVPKVVNRRSLEWLEDLTRTQLDLELGKAFRAFRTAYGLKRRQLNVHGPQDRRGVIETPFFNYEAIVELDNDAPDQVLWICEINQIRDASRLVSSEFDQCFEPVSWNLEVTFEQNLDLADIVDRIEDEEDEGFGVDYDKNLRWCEIKVPDCQAILRATPNSFNVSFASGSSPRQLLLALIQFQTHLMEQLGPLNLQHTI